MTTLRKAATGLLVAGSVWSTPALAQIGGLLPTVDNPPTRQGTRGSNFLHLGIGAVGNAMAGAVGSSVHGPVAWFWNPAGAAASEGISLAGGLQNLYGDLGVKQAYGALSVPLLGGMAGLSFNSLNSGDIPRATEQFPFGRVGAGTQFNWTSTAVGLGYARRLTDRLSVGVLGKFVSEGIVDANTHWTALDVGTQFNTGVYGMVLGGALQSIGGAARAGGALINRQFDNANINRARTRTDLYTRPTDLPTSFRFALGNEVYGSAESMLGGAGSANRLYVELQATDAVDLAASYAAGAEYSFRNVLFLRGGKRFYSDERDIGVSAGTYGLSGGLGLKWALKGRDLRFDYSYTNVGDLRDIQVFSFEFGR